MGGGARHTSWAVKGMAAMHFVAGAFGG